MDFKRKNIIRFLSLSLTLVLAAGNPAQAGKNQQADSQPIVQSEKINDTQISDKKIKAYAASAIEITRIHNEMAPKIRAARTDQEQKVMYVDMQEQMADILEKTDNITLEEYNQISAQAQTNPQLINRIRTAFQILQKRGS